MPLGNFKLFQQGQPLFLGQPFQRQPFQRQLFQRQLFQRVAVLKGSFFKGQLFQRQPFQRVAVLELADLELAVLELASLKHRRFCFIKDISLRNLYEITLVPSSVHFWKCKNSLNYCFCIQVSYLIVDDADMEMEMAKDPFLEARLYRTELIENRFITCTTNFGKLACKISMQNF